MCLFRARWIESKVLEEHVSMHVNMAMILQCIEFPSVTHGYEATHSSNLKVELS